MDLLEMKHIFDECIKISYKKSRDYGDLSLQEFGRYGIMIRMWDKMCRLKTLLSNKDISPAVDESIEDTAIDLINYSAYLIMMKKK